MIRRRENGLILENVSLRTEETSLRVDGTIGNIEERRRTIDLKASSDKFDVEEIAQVVPALRGYAMQPAFEISATRSARPPGGRSERARGERRPGRPAT